MNNGPRRWRSSTAWDSPRRSCLHKLPRSPIRLRRRAAEQRKIELIMSALIEARDLTKNYGSQLALDRVNFSIESGRIVGLIGPNGAGKTSALRAILGLTAYRGHLNVLGREPFANRAALMQEASFIADVAVLPSWLKVEQAIDFVAGGPPRFCRDPGPALAS